MTRDVHGVLVTYGREYEQDALAILEPTVSRLFPGASLNIIVVDNASPDGDNRVREFSGWDLGLARLQRKGPLDPNGIVVIANDTVVRPDKRQRVVATPERCAAAAADGALVGFIDEYPSAVEAFGFRFRQFLDTSFVFGTTRTFAALGPLAQAPADGDIFDDDWRYFFRQPSPLSANYRAYLRAYFFGEPIDEDFPHRWHGQEPLGERNADAFKAKLRCVFCEHLLSARAMARGIPLVDIRPAPLAIELPRVSVIIPCFNLGRYLDEAVASVLAQTFQDFEIVVVDDGSTDPETRSLLDDYRRPRTRIIRAEHRGVSAARNTGIACSAGTYICALDADDRLEPTYLEKAAAALDGDPTLSFASCWVRVFGDEAWEWTPERCDLATILAEDSVCTAALIRRAALVAVGGYDTEMPVQGAEDWDLWLTLVSRGYRGTILRELLFNYRRRAGSLSSVAWYGDGHVPLANYRFAKHADAYRAHLVDVFLHQDAETAGLLRRNDELERYITSDLEPRIASRREELAAVRDRLTVAEQRDRVVGKPASGDSA